MPSPPPPVQPHGVVTTVPANVANYQTIVDTLKANSGAEAKALRAMFGGDKQLTDRFLSVCFSLLAADSDLLRKADPMTIVEAIKKAASLGLEPMTEDAAIVAYDGKATLLPMYRGYLKRMRRSGLVKQVAAKMVYEHDEFEYWEDDTGFHFRHAPTPLGQDRGDYRGAYAYAAMSDGFVHGQVMTVAELNHVRDTYGNKQSRNGRPLPWVTSYDQMCLKTVIRRLAKMMPQEAVGQDFLALEREADKEEDRVRVLAKEVRDDLADVRQIALRAVGQLPPGTIDTDAAALPDAAGAASSSDDGAEPVVATAEPAATPPVPPDPTAVPSQEADPNVAAAMDLAAEQERLRRFRHQ